MFEMSYMYYRLPEELDNRLDVLYNSTLFDAVYATIKNSIYPFVSLGSMIDLSTERRDPRKEPDVEFSYVNIGCIDTFVGIPYPSTMIGSEATSDRMRMVINKGDVLVSTTRPTRDAICVVPQEYDDQICSTGLAVLKNKPDVDIRFLFFSLRSQITNKQLEKHCSGSGYPAIIKEDLCEILLPKPTLPQQNYIVGQLTPIYDMVVKLRLKAEQIRIASSDKLVSELKISIPLVADINYCHSTGKEKESLHFTVFPDSLQDRLHYLYYHPNRMILTLFMDMYNTCCLSDICTVPITRGKQPDYADESTEYIVIKTTNLKNEFIDYSDCMNVTKAFFYKHDSGHLRKGDILIASTGVGSLGKVDIYEGDVPAIADSHLSIIRVDSKRYNPYFVLYFLRSHLAQIQISMLFTGASGQIELQPTDVAKIAIPSCDDTDGKAVVDKCEQDRIATIVGKELKKLRRINKQAEDMNEMLNLKYEELIFRTRR